MDRSWDYINRSMNVDIGTEAVKHKSDFRCSVGSEGNKMFPLILNTGDENRLVGIKKKAGIDKRNMSEGL